MENLKGENHVEREENVQEWDSKKGEGVVTVLVVLKLRYRS